MLETILVAFYLSPFIPWLVFLSVDEMQQFGSLKSLFSNILTKITIRIFVI